MLADLRNWLRDPLLAVAAVGPVVLALVVRLGAPAVEDLAAPAVSLPTYYPVVVGALSVLYGFVVGMFLLEDRERGVLTAYRVTPLAGRGYLLYRCLTAYLQSAVATLPALALVGLVDVPLSVLFGTTAMAALGGPAFALAFGSLAENTVGGIALGKLANLVVLAPAVVVAVVPVPLQFLAGVLPTYWPVKAVEAGVRGDSAWPLFVAVGVGAYVLVLGGLGRLFVRRAD